MKLLLSRVLDIHSSTFQKHVILKYALRVIQSFSISMRGLHSSLGYALNDADDLEFLETISGVFISLSLSSQLR